MLPEELFRMSKKWLSKEQREELSRKRSRAEQKKEREGQ